MPSRPGSQNPSCLRLFPIAKVLGGLLLFFSGTYLMPIAALADLRRRHPDRFVLAGGIEARPRCDLPVAATGARSPRDGFLLVTLA